MPLKIYKPTSPARRAQTGFDFSDLSKKEPEKGLIASQHKTGGRNSRGLVTARHRGGGARQYYRMIDFKRNKDDMPAKVLALEYDPNRSCRIALLQFADGEKRYILAPIGLSVGMTVMTGEKVEPRVGNAMKLKNIPLGESIHNIELKPGRGGQIARSAGCHCQLLAKEGHYAHVTMPSGEVRKIYIECRATIGQVGNIDHANVSIGKAGRNRHRGWRPYVRGTVMNPHDHPLGGGEGKTGAGGEPCGPTGVLSKGGKTRNPRKLSNKHIIRRRKK
jgi:large subunit ribosomal protein L2